MKNYKNMLLPLGIVLLVIISVSLAQKNKKVNTTLEEIISETSSEEASQMCFLYEDTSELDISNPEAKNYELVEVTMLGDNRVTGIHNILPFDADSNIGTFVGVTDGEFVNVITTAKGEGKTWQEQRVYKIEGSKLFVGYQPVYVPQFQDDNGIYMYEDVNQLVFKTEKFHLDEVNCVNIPDAARA